MDKLVTIKIGNINRDLGYPVTLEIAEEQWSDDRIWLHNLLEKKGELPSASELLQDYYDWQKSYRNLDINHRLDADPAQITNISSIDLVLTCQSAAQISIDSFNRWLNAESFHQIREHLAKNISAEDRVRFLLQIEDPQLYHLPWQLGDIFASYNSTEVVLSSPQFEGIQDSNSATKFGVRILAILGNSQGINIKVDRKILAKLPNAKVEFLVEPQRQELTDRLWEHNWDILFFAGHSSSSNDNTTGKIFINQTDSLSLEELRYGLKKAIANGLKIAIFNSCDGLGLAKSLADLQIPQVIVMREPIPDRVAQTFLKGFLEQYSQGKSFYRSVREAREKLQGLEDRFPCATWLPTVFQYGVSHPPSWQQLQSSVNIKQRHLNVVLLSSLVTTIAIAATRFLGLIQPLELNAFDLTMRSRPSEQQKDSKILVIEVTPESTEIQINNGVNSGSSLSDEYLNRLLDKLKPLEPRIIGIDNFLSHRIDPKYSSIHDSLKSGDLITVCKTEDASKGGDINQKDREKPPPLTATKFAFGDTIADSDNVIRRHLLAMDAKSIKPGARCNSDLALSMRLAYEYLYLDPQEIKLEIGNDTILFKRGSTNKMDENIRISGWPNYQLSTDRQVLHKFSAKDFKEYLTANTGGYQGFDFNDSGYQLLLNYRAFNNSIRLAIPSISLKDVLELPPDKLQETVGDRLILIGTTDPNYGDIVKTPYGNIPGVFHQAQMTSQLISAALEHRPLFWAQPFWVDISIVLFCAITGAVLASRVRPNWVLVIVFGSIIVMLCGGSVWLLASFGYWFPLMPSLLGLAIAGGYVKIYLLRATKFPLVNSNFLVSTSRYKSI
jgi:CHASE2 domain-containing sensor protein